ncbi:MAG: hypothetical protein GY805_32955 [Chloroflexi bacterium]|nr:hypothetical protein [Chloroflexota bacterium]
MKGANKFLVGMIIGIVVLIVTALVVVMTRPDPTFRAEDTAEGVAYNYLLALQQGDYERAYGYISPKINCYPSNVDRFISELNRGSSLDESSFSVDSAFVSGQRATVTVQETRFSQGDLLDSSQSTSSFEIVLARDGNTWKITTVNGYYYYGNFWSGRWDRNNNCS